MMAFRINSVVEYRAITAAGVPLQCEEANSLNDLNWSLGLIGVRPFQDISFP
jgi:hypothetical protein